MGINEIGERLRPPLLGKISMGMTVATKSGFDRPVNAEYFVIKNLSPYFQDKIKTVYGEQPSYLDIIFPDNDPDKVIPTWYKWWSSGTKDSQGNRIGGRLRCFGDGPHSDGTPGEATYLEKADPFTKIAPKRPCLGRACPDFYNAKGQQQCKQSMQVFCVLPLIDFKGMFQIDTTSWNSIKSFHEVIGWTRKHNNGVIADRAYRIYRQEEVTNYIDPTTGQQKTGTQFIMYLEENPDFLHKHSPQMLGVIRDSFKTYEFLPAERAAIEYPTSAALIEESSLGEVAEAAQIEAPLTPEQIKAKKNEYSRSLLQDQDVCAALAELEARQGKVITPKQRLDAIMRMENEPNQKQAVINAIGAKIVALSPVAHHDAAIEQRAEDIAQAQVEANQEQMAAQTEVPPGMINPDEGIC